MHTERMKEAIALLRAADVNVLQALDIYRVTLRGRKRAYFDAYGHHNMKHSGPGDVADALQKLLDREAG